MFDQHFGDLVGLGVVGDQHREVQGRLPALDFELVHQVVCVLIQIPLHLFD